MLEKTKTRVLNTQINTHFKNSEYTTYDKNHIISLNKMLVISSHGQFWRGDWLLSRARLIWKTERRRWNVNKVKLGIICNFIFKFYVITFTNSDIYGCVRTINATIPFHSLSNNVNFYLFTFLNCCIKKNVVFEF